MNHIAYVDIKTLISTETQEHQNVGRIGKNTVNTQFHSSLFTAPHNISLSYHGNKDGLDLLFIESV